jgi:oligoribonuclease
MKDILMAEYKEQNLVWIDLEMTGLRPEKDFILEIASLVTDSQLNIIAQGPSLIIHHPHYCLQDMDDWVMKTHTASGLLDAVRLSTIGIEQAEQATLDFLCRYCLPGQSPLCGNSIWQDRAFMRIYMPRIISYVHYRMIDVTAFKEMITRWYPNDPRTTYKKQDNHRAMDDIKESVAELVYYRKNFFTH